MGKVVGIDLGTTFSAVAHVNEYGKPEILPNSDSDRITPSAIMFEDDLMTVGKTAKRFAKSDPDQVVEFVKREMGQSREDYYREFKGKKYSADELSAVILKKLKQDAEAALGEEITDAVITVPAYFHDAEREATRNAGRIAGLNVLQLLNEPTAAALAYGVDKLGQDQRVFVFDLGGGTFDVTLMEIIGSTIRMVETNGDHRLGGKDWDDKIAIHVATAFKAEHGSDPLEDKHAAQELQLEATEAKETLSKRQKTTIVCGYGGKTTRVELTREGFDNLTRDLVDQCRELCDMVLADAKATWTDIDTVLLVGGSTRMPMIQEMIRNVSGKDINPQEVNPDEAVALGAAIHAALRDIEDEPHENVGVAEAIKERYGASAIRVVDGASHSLGVVLVGSDERTEYNHVMIEKMTEVPCTRDQGDLWTVVENQRKVVFRVVQGLDDGQKETSAIRFADYEIGQVVLPLPPGLPKHAPLHLTYKYNVDQTLEVTARGPDGRVEGAHINRSTLGDREVAQAAVHMQRMEVE